MRQFMMTVMALTAFGAMMVAAQAEIGGGAPMRNGDQCFKYSGSAAGERWFQERDGRYGSWGPCPQAVSPEARRVAAKYRGYSDWLTSDEYQKLFDTTVPQHLYPRAVEARAFNGSVLYHAAFVPYPAGNFSFYSHHGITADKFAERNELYRRNGFRLEHKQSVHLLGRDFIQATWIRP